MVVTAVTVFFVFAGTVMCADHELRLSNVGGKEGRVEVLNEGQWGTVCRDGWDFYDALVVCKQLGFSWLANDGWRYDAGNGTGPAWLSNVQCDGSETRLDECPNDGWREHQCTDETTKAAVSCLDRNDLEEYNFSAVLSGGNGPLVLDIEGRVIVNLEHDFETYYLLCDHGWDLADADIICRQGGYHSAYRAVTNSYFGKYKAPLNHYKLVYLATEFACIGNESNILQCPAQAWFRDDCPPGHDAGIICNRIEEPEGFQLRLRGSPNPNEGRVEVHLNGTWGTICRDDGDYEIEYRMSNVICHQLGLGYTLEVPTDDRFGRTSGPVVMSDYIFCTGGESSLAQCYRFRSKPDPECLSQDGSYELSVICSGSIPESRYPIRLSDSPKTTGEVLIYYDNRWGSICATGWTSANSEVVCRELGLGPPEELYKSYHIEGPMFLGGVSCTGDETTLDQCKRGELNQVDCDQNVVLSCSRSGSESSHGVSFGLLLTSLVSVFCFLQ